MMAASIVLVLVASNAIMKSHFARETALGEQLEGAIDRGNSDARVAFAHELVKLFDGKVLVSFKEGEKNRIALLSPFEADAFEMLLKTKLRLAQPLLRDRDRIIDAFLQHFSAF